MKRSPLMAASMKVVPSLRERSRLLGEELVEYEYRRPRGEVENYQLRAFNAAWSRAVEEVPFYAHWKAVNSLPSEVGSLRDLADFPDLTKAHLRDSEALVNQTLGIKSWISTGGSTGEPVRIPKGVGEPTDLYVNNYVARAWAGVSPADRYFHVWGHSHLFGSGLARKKNIAVRHAKDYVLGAIRVPSYDQSLAKAEEYAKLVGESNPVYVLGATSSVVRIAAAIKNMERRWRRPSNLRSVTVTAEAAAPADVDLIEEAFGVPCFVEYGASEVGVIACSTEGERDLSVLWRSIHLWSGGDNEFRITSLKKRAFPLFNYVLGDRGVDSNEEFTVLSIRSLEGRSHEILELRRPNGELVNVNCTGLVHSVKANWPFRIQSA